MLSDAGTGPLPQAGHRSSSHPTQSQKPSRRLGADTRRAHVSWNASAQAEQKYVSPPALLQLPQLLLWLSVPPCASGGRDAVALRQASASRMIHR